MAGGGSFIDPEVARVWAAAQARHGGSPITMLTGREHQVLAEMAGGRNNAAIARSLVTSERAVEWKSTSTPSSPSSASPVIPARTGGSLRCWPT